MSHKASKHKQRGIPNSHRYGGSGWNMLAASIVGRAVADTKLLQRPRKSSIMTGYNVTEDELRQFFCSRYCGVLLGCTDYTGPQIARALGLIKEEEYR